MQATETGQDPSSPITPTYRLIKLVSPSTPTYSDMGCGMHAVHVYLTARLCIVSE